MFRQIRVLALLALGVGLGAGCSRGPKNTAMSERFTFASGLRATTGADLKSYYYSWSVIQFDGRPIGMVMANVPGQTGSRERVTFNEHDGRQVPVEWRGADDGTAKVTIDGQEFDLAAGGLLLVTLPDRPARVRQIATEIAPLTDKPPSALKLLGEKNPEVQAFLDSCLR